MRTPFHSCFFACLGSFLFTQWPCIRPFRCCCDGSDKDLKVSVESLAHYIFNMTHSECIHLPKPAFPLFIAWREGRHWNRIWSVHADSGPGSAWAALGNTFLTLPSMGLSKEWSKDKKKQRRWHQICLGKRHWQPRDCVGGKGKASFLFACLFDWLVGFLR